MQYADKNKNKMPNQAIWKPASSENISIAGQSAETSYPVQVYYTELTGIDMQKIRWHWHAEVEIIIINHGEADFFSDDRQIRLSAGQGILINQNLMHSIQMDPESSTCSLYSLKFHPSFLFGGENTTLSDKYWTPVLNSADLKIIELFDQDTWHEKLMDLINSVIAVNLAKKYGYELVTKAYLCQLWELLLKRLISENADAGKESSSSLNESRIKEVISYIEQHYSERITLDDLAGCIRISKSECCRCFKRTLQVTPFEYLMKYRILRAADMLQQNTASSHSMSELAYSVGFNNASYFNKVFRQYLHCTPSEYKRRLKKDPISESMPLS